MIVETLPGRIVYRMHNVKTVALRQEVMYEEQSRDFSIYEKWKKRYGDKLRHRFDHQIRYSRSGTDFSSRTTTKYEFTYTHTT